MSTYQEILDSLEKCQKRMQSAEFQTWIESQSNEDILKIRQKQGKLMVCIKDLRNRRLEEITESLEKTATDLKAGIADLQNEIQKLENAINFLNKVSRVINKLVGILDLIL